MYHSEQDTIDYTQIEINFQEQTAMRAQQRMSLTEPFITYIGGRGRETKTTFWGLNKLDQKTQRHASYPQAETPREAYWFGSTHFWKKEPLDGDDALYEATDPATGLSQVWAAAAAREKDRLHINAALGTAYRGRFGQTSAQPLPASRIIPHGSTGLTREKITQGVSMIRRAHPDNMDPIVLMVTSYQLNIDLMDITEVTSADFNRDMPLRDLRLPYFFGTYFKTIDDTADYHPADPDNVVEWDPILPIDVDGVSAGVHIRYCVMWVKSAMRGRKDLEITTKIHSEEKDHGPMSKSITVDMIEGSARVNPLGVVVIECAEESTVAEAA
jgi:hypothetical protein